MLTTPAIIASSPPNVGDMVPYASKRRPAVIRTVRPTGVRMKRKKTM
jgi:hypothetical protein